MLRTSSDRIFWHDSSPEYQEYLNTPWSERYAPITESFRELSEQMMTFSSVLETWGKAWVEPISAEPIQYNQGGLIPQIQTFFTNDLGRIEGTPGPSTHDDRGRPLLDATGGVSRPVTVCPRHGEQMDHGWCRRCRR